MAKSGIVYATLSAFSAALFVLLFAHLWIHAPGHSIEWRGPSERWYLATDGYPFPRLRIHRSWDWPSGDTTPSSAVYSEAGARRVSDYAGVEVIRGFADVRRKGLSNVRVEYLDVVVQALVVLLLTAALPVSYAAGWVYRWRRAAARLAAGCCVGCGYDLSGNDSGRCPECGRVVGRTVASA